MDLAALQTLVDQAATPKGPDPQWKENLRQAFGLIVQEEAALSAYTWIRLGGPAEVLACPQNTSQLAELLSFCHQQQVPWQVLGRGSNVLIRDGGLPGLTLVLGKGIDALEPLEAEADQVRVRAGAGLPLPQLVQWATDQAAKGVPGLYGVPGTVGGAIKMNAGTRVSEVAHFLESLDLVDREGNLHSIPAKRIKFDYRHVQLPQSGVIVSGIFVFEKGKVDEVRQEVQDYQNRRRQTQPLDKPNLGSIFKNPPKHFAAELIEEVGLKGVRVGGARISDKHANFIINEGQASAKDVLALMGLAKDKVKEKLDIVLEAEVKVMGKDLVSDKA